MKNPLLPHGVSSKEKALLTIHPRFSEGGILAFSRKRVVSLWPYGLGVSHDTDADTV